MIMALTPTYSQNWIVYTPYNTGLPSDEINSIAIEANGNIWSGTYVGLSKFDGNHWIVSKRSRRIREDFPK